jgi:hypothetical protein
MENCEQLENNAKTRDPTAPGPFPSFRISSTRSKVPTGDKPVPQAIVHLVRPPEIPLKKHNTLSVNRLKSYETVSHDLCTSCSQVSFRTMPLPETLSNTAIPRYRRRGPIVNNPRIPPSDPLIGPSGKGRIRPLERILRPQSAGSPR